MKKPAVQPMEPRSGRLCLDGWAGRSYVPVVVTGETQKRYRVRFVEATKLPHLGTAAAGDVRLVPKYSVVLLPMPVGPYRHAGAAVGAASHPQGASHDERSTFTLPEDVDVRAGDQLVAKQAPSVDEALARVRQAGETGDFEMAPADALGVYEAEVREICAVLRSVLGIRVSFLSDMSSMGDFRRDESDDDYYARLSEALGLTIARGDRVLDICHRLRQKRLD